MVLFLAFDSGYQHIRMYDINSNNPSPVSRNCAVFLSKTLYSHSVSLYLETIRL